LGLEPTLAVTLSNSPRLTRYSLDFLFFVGFRVSSTQVVTTGLPCTLNLSYLNLKKEEVLSLFFILAIVPMIKIIKMEPFMEFKFFS
jgi:hypothetical protein